MRASSRGPLLQRGDLLGGKWEIQEHIATGGKGEVYRARQVNLDREVAVKIVSQELIEAYGDDEEEIRAEMERFRREVLAMARARHVNVLQVYDFETATLEKDGREITLEYIVMEYIPGPTLSVTIPEEGLRGDEESFRRWIRRYYLPILDGVEHIHRQGIVHRDLKPANVLLDGEVPKITDFGLVGGKLWRPVTQSHHVMGTIAYMAPEQYLEMADTDFRADVYSLGKILYHAAVGKLDKETMLPLRTAFLPRPDTPFLKALDRVIRLATAEDRSQRLPSVADLRERVQALLASSTPAVLVRPPRRHLLMVAGLGLALVALVAWGVWFHFTSARPLPEPAAVHPAAPAAVPSVSRGAPPPRLTTEDGARMRLVPGGEVRLPDGSKKAVAPFYLDETLVTNHQYVEFLNAMLPHLRVEGDRVKLGGEVLLRLGQVRQGVEPIVFRNGRFHLQDPSLAAHPVVRVTGFGAAAYAAHYRKRLPTPGQWLRAREGGAAVPSRVAPQDPMAAMHARMAAPVAPALREDYAPVTQSPPNRYGIRGLGGPVGEWLQGQDGRNDRERFWVAPGSRTAAAGNLQPQSPREAFATVGFRCARPVPSGQSPEPGRAGKE